MNPEELSRGLETRLIGRRIFSYEALDSTNDAARKLGDEGLPEGTCVFAEFQKKGRGRLGRSWSSPRGKNLLFSVLLRPRLSPAEVSKITLTAAVSLVKVILEITGVRAGIQWPNDIFCEGRKICGILTEMSACPPESPAEEGAHFVVVGIGLNVNSGVRELPQGASSLGEITGKSFSRVELARAILRQFEKDYLVFNKGRFEEIAGEWENYSLTSGRRVTATVLGRKIQGRATGIDGDGALWIRQDNGLQERITAGDIEHLCAL